MQISLAGKRALVTGASSGLGLHFAQVLAAAGAGVTLAARRLEKVTEAAEVLRDRGLLAEAGRIDVTAPESIAAFFHGREPFDIVINNAGIAGEGSAMDMELDAFRNVVDTNLTGVFAVAQAAARGMKEAGGGSIVNIASILGLRVSGHVSAYAASKAAVVQLTKALALEWARHDVRVNALCPGYIETPINAVFFETDAGKALIRRIPQRRLGRLGDLDGPLLLLASDQVGVHDGCRRGRRWRAPRLGIVGPADGFLGHSELRDRMRKWFTTGAGEAQHFILIARTSDDARRGHTAFLFHRDDPGWEIVRRIRIMGPEEHGGHCELVFEGLRILQENVLVGEGRGLKVAQTRLGPAWLTHCMRWLGLAKRLRRDRAGLCRAARELLHPAGRPRKRADHAWRSGDADRGRAVACDEGGMGDRPGRLRAKGGGGQSNPSWLLDCRVHSSFLRRQPQGLFLGGAHRSTTSIAGAACRRCSRPAAGPVLCRSRLPRDAILPDAAGQGMASAPLPEIEARRGS